MPMKISVIIPTYNYGRYILEAIESVQRQSVPDLEIIVIDDGSSDDTQRVLCGVSDVRLRVHRTPNRGISAARNEGLRRARGKFIAFLDADDRWRPGKLRLQLQMMESEPDLGAVFTNFVRFRDDEVFPLDQFAFFPELRRVPSVVSRAGHGRRVVGEAFSQFVAFGEFPTWVQTMLFRAEVIRGMRFPAKHQTQGAVRYSLCEDLHFCLRAFDRAPVGYLEEPLVEVRRHGENITSRLSEMPHAKLEALRLLETEALNARARAALRRRVGRAWVDSGRIHVGEGRFWKGLLAYREAMRYGGFRHSALKQLLLFPLAAARHSLRGDSAA
jgi:glycosyltransferase involved in cell wall biosynthesis